MEIPDFLRPDNSKPNKKDIKMKELMEKYKKCFGEYPTTEPSVYNTDEWIDILNRCIKENIQICYLLEGELEVEGVKDYDCIIIKS